MAQEQADPRGTQVIRLAEDSLTSSSTQFHALIDEFAAQGHVRIAADMSKVKDLPGPAFGRLMLAMKRLREAGGDLRLFGLQERARKTLLTVPPPDGPLVSATQDGALGSFDS